MNARRERSGLRFWTMLMAGLSLLSLLAATALVALHAASPSSVPLTVFAPFVWLMTGTGAAALALGAAYFALQYPGRRRVILVVVMITLGIFAAHLYTIGTPTTQNCYDSGKQVNGCVMDEVYYVPAAQTLIAGTRCAPYADSCNLEHPFLSKAFIAAGIMLFGDNVFGWRISEVLFGTACIPLLFAVCWIATRNPALSLIATYLLAFETLFFVHSSIGVIDVHSVFFVLLAFFFYFAGRRLWKLDRYVLAGIALALAGLSKETAVFMAALLVSYHLLFGEGARRARLVSTAKMLGVLSVVFAGAMQFYDSYFGTKAVGTFLDQIRFMLSYGASLTGTSGAWFDTTFHNVITPLHWMVFYSPVGYLVTTVKVTGTSNYKYVGVGYYGIPNMFEMWLTYVWIGYVVYVLWRSRGALALERSSMDFKLASFAALWFAFAFLPYVFLWAYGRVTYPYYIIDGVPGIAIGCAYLLSRPWFARPVVYVLLAGVFVWFFIYYPDKSFLPVPLRVLIGR